jgi:transcriptional regulator with XRE-family HTH domain
MCYRSGVTDHERAKPGRFLPSNIRRQRERQDMSRKALAEAMQARGHKWHPNTVARIEDGSQQLTVDEFFDIAHVLGTSTDRLSWAQGEDAEHLAASGAITRLRQAADEAAWSVARFHAARSSAGRASADAARSSYPRVRALADAISEELQDATLDNVLATAQARWDEMRSGG